MKFQKFVTLSLLTTIVGGISVPLTSSAAKSTGKVKVGVGTIDPTDPIVDPENPNTEPGIDSSNPGLEGGDDPLGPLSITNTSTLDFGEIQTGNSKITQPANYFSVVDSENKEVAKRGHIVSWSDIRGTNAGYTITAAMTKQFSLADNSKKLGGATITYTNPLLETKAINSTIAPSLTADATSFELGEDGAATKVVEAANGKGAGTYVLEFGQSAEYDATNQVVGNPAIQKGVDTTGNSVFLDVPAATAASMTVGDYTAEVTWTISAIPDATENPAAPETPAT